MDCRETEQLIQKYINRELEAKKLADFVQHIEECGSCREELEINFLVQEGLLRLESGQSFDLHYELMKRLDESNKRIERRKKFLAAVIIIIIAACTAGLTTLASWLF